MRKDLKHLVDDVFRSLFLSANPVALMQILSYNLPFGKYLVPRVYAQNLCFPITVISGLDHIQALVAVSGLK